VSHRTGDAPPPTSWAGILVPGAVLLVFLALLLLIAVFGFLLWLELGMANMN